MLTVLDSPEGNELHVFHSQRRFVDSEIFKEPDMMALCGHTTVNNCTYKIDSYHSFEQAKTVMVFMENYTCKNCLAALDEMHLIETATRRTPN